MARRVPRFLQGREATAAHRPQEDGLEAWRENRVGTKGSETLMASPIDKNGNVHDENGQFVSLRAYIEAILSEKEKQTEFSRVQLEKALTQAAQTTERALVEARVTVEAKLVEAKAAADERANTQQKRIDLLESGGAPFASRLDESLTALKADVDVLKVNMVRTTVLDALREQTVAETKAQKRQIRYIAIAAAVSFALSLILIGVQVLTK
jgi:hypothetical protein